jgi:hypothetical protein
VLITNHGICFSNQVAFALTTGFSGAVRKARQLPDRWPAHGSRCQSLQGRQLPHHEPAREDTLRSCLQVHDNPLITRPQCISLAFFDFTLITLNLVNTLYGSRKHLICKLK